MVSRKTTRFQSLDLGVGEVGVRETGRPNGDDDLRPYERRRQMGGECQLCEWRSQIGGDWRRCDLRMAAF
jgi:hypothetical protein